MASTVRVTQQVLTGAYTTNPQGRVTAMALEVIRSVDSTGLSSGTQPVLIMATS